MPDNTAESWGQFLLRVAQEAEHDANEHDTDKKLHGQLGDLALSLRAWSAALWSVEKVVTPSEPIIADANETIRFERELIPSNWPTIAKARAALHLLNERQHRALTNTRQRHLSRVIELVREKGEGVASDTADLELSQHKLAAERLEDLDVQFARHRDEIEALPDLDAARAYASLFGVNDDGPAA